MEMQPRRLMMFRTAHPAQFLARRLLELVDAHPIGVQ